MRAVVGALEFSHERENQRNFEKKKALNKDLKISSKVKKKEKHPKSGKSHLSTLAFSFPRPMARSLHFILFTIKVI